MKCLIKYCNENFIKLQLSNCGILCVNSKTTEDNEPIIVDRVILECKTYEIYLVSVITNSHLLSHDVEADIKRRQISFIKYFAFLRSNKNAPVKVKVIVLQSCIISSLLHNAETWADTKIEKLEVMYRRMMKAILGVRMTTFSEFVYIELGLVSIKTQIKMKQWKLWKSLSNLDNNDPLIHAITSKTLQIERSKLLRKFSP